MRSGSESKILYGAVAAFGLIASCVRPEPVQRPVTPTVIVLPQTPISLEPRFGGLIIKPDSGKSILTGDLANFSSYNLEVDTDRLDKIVKELQLSSSRPGGGELVVNVFANKTPSSNERGKLFSSVVTLMRASNTMRNLPEWSEKGRVYDPADLRVEIMYLESGDTSERGLSERLIRHMVRGSQATSIPLENIVIPSQISDQINRQTLIRIINKTALNPLLPIPTIPPRGSA